VRVAAEKAPGELSSGIEEVACYFEKIAGNLY